LPAGVVVVGDVDRRAVEAYPGDDWRQERRDRRPAPGNPALDTDRRVARTRGARRSVVEEVAVAQQVEPGAAPHVDVGERLVEPRGDDGERGTQHRGSPDLVGVHVPGGEERQQRVALLQAQVDEQRAGVGVGLARVDGGQRVVEPAEQEVVHGGEQQHRVVALGRRLGDHLQHGFARGDGPADAVVERRVAPARRVGDVDPDARQRVVVAHSSMSACVWNEFCTLMLAWVAPKYSGPERPRPVPVTPDG